MSAMSGSRGRMSSGERGYSAMRGSSKKRTASGVGNSLKNSKLSEKRSAGGNRSSSAVGRGSSKAKPSDVKKSSNGR